MKLFFGKDYYVDAFQADTDESAKPNRNWCERNMIIKDPKNSRVFYFWQLLFLFAVLIEVVLVPYT